MKLLVLAEPNASDRMVDLFLRSTYGFSVSDNTSYSIVRNREEWEIPDIQEGKFDGWTKIGAADAWTQLRVVEKLGESIEQRLMRQYFTGPVAPPLGTH